MHQSRRRLAVISAATGVLVIGMASLAAAATGSSNPVKAPKQIEIETTIVDDSTTAVTVTVPSSSDPSTSAPADTVSTIADDSTSVPGSTPGSVPSSSDPSTSVDDHGSGGHGADDGPGHDVGDDHGGDRDDSSSDDGPGHDVGDDHGGDDDSDDDHSGSGKGGSGGGSDDGADHDAGDDHGGGGHGSDD